MDDNSPWTTALDINGHEIATGIWDCAPASKTPYGYSGALYYRGKFKGDQVRYDQILPYKKKNKSTGDSTNYYPETSGMINPTTYKRTYGTGYTKVKGDGDGNKMYSEAGSFFHTKQARNQGEFPQGIALRNYSTGTASYGSQAYAEVCFAVNTKGDYRFVFDNLRQGIRKQAEINWEYNSTDGGQPYIVSFNNEGFDWGPGVKVDIFDMYNERPIHGVWGTNSPSQAIINTASGDNYFAKNVTNANYTWYAYTVNPTPQTTFEGAVDENNWNPANNQYEYLFAKEPVFRYVSKFYTRAWSGSEWVYTPWTGSANTGWHAFTKRNVSPDNNTIPSPTQITPNGTWFFPEDAGVPFGDERAMGPLITESGGTLYRTWAVKVEGNTGVFIPNGLPRPASYLDYSTTEPTWWENDGDWNSGPQSQ